MGLYADNAPNLAAAVITIGLLGYICYILRVICRVRYSSWGLEDWAMTIAMFPFTVLTVACIACAFTGIGATNRTLALPGNEGYEKRGLFWFFLFEVFYCASVIPVKMSISLMLIRIAQNRKSFIWMQYVIIGMFTIMNLIAMMYIILQCNPVAAAWDTSLLQNGGKCNDMKILADIYYATTAVNILTDWVTAFMPILLLWKVNMNRNSKISVSFVLGLGFFASLSACIRLKYTVGLTDAENYLFAVSDIVIWGYAENGLGVAVGSMATLKPLFRRVFGLSNADSGPGTNTWGGRSRKYAFPLDSRRTYAEEDGFELPSTSTPRPGKHGATGVTTQVGASHDKDSLSLSDSESQRKIMGEGHERNIYVSRQVNITHDG
ncbi:Uu.00g056470.m01.CDS01 [Anthostomella pinea]|uniref:Uu.00g056470.m01.CDS01 n=1 Tax=Anthostomella pinea TaxID=933095 RepID=A0AAI8VSN6_9PEZI|nr:Uu.00g056470.m01.CDS01 [Anthostomella pinea]